MKRTLAVIALFAACNSCRGGRDTEGTTQQQPETAGKTGTASITGAITYKGALPAAPQRTPTADCAKLAGPPPAVLAVARESSGVKDAFVWIKEGIEGKYPVPSEPVTLDQKGCEYTPRVFGARAGQTIVLANSDPLLHNVHAPGFNVPLANAGVKVERKFTRPEVMASITCDVHPWMRAYAGVVAHPFFAVSKADGTFEIKGLPAGSYTVEVWQEKLGRRTEKVTVADGEAKTANFELKAP
jgi:plastocyanin